MNVHPWTVLGSRYLLKRWWMNLRVDHVRLPNGHELEEFHVVEYPDWVCAIPLTPGGELVMVEQYRHGVARLSLEFPAGALEADEPPEAAARRELEEETGYVAEAWEPVGVCAQEPSKHNNYAHIFVCRNARPGGRPHPDDGEQLALRLVRPAEARRLLDEGALIHASHALALLWAAQRGLIDLSA